jgi:hypothetical protein
MKFVVAALSLALLAGCQSMPESKEASSNPSSQRDGSTPELAVDLSYAHTESEGIRAERDWIEQHFPGAKVASQALLMTSKPMDLMTLTLPSGETEKVYFDISSYFGKM